MMLRRRFLTACASMPLLACWRATQGPPWGPIDIARHNALRQRGIDLHVFWRGEDVTKACSFVDDTTGRARLYLRNADGCFYLDPARKFAAYQWVTGVEIRAL